MIQAYFTQIKTVVDQYATTKFVLATRINFETRPRNQGYLTGSITFIDESVLHFREFLDQLDERVVDKLMYSYHYQDHVQQLIFRYDNALHKPPLSSLEHKHLPDKVIAASAPTLDDVLVEIVTLKAWV